MRVLERAKQAAAITSGPVVGITGSAIPTSPTATASSPPVNHSEREVRLRTRDGAGPGDGGLVMAGLTVAVHGRAGQGTLTLICHGRPGNRVVGMPLALAAALTFVWLGMVLAISFLEAPLKFRAPGITIPLGVGIGRLVFRALNIAEAVLWLAVLAGLLLRAADASPAQLALVVLVGVDLGLGALVLRPLMDRKVRTEGSADHAPRTRLHLGYIALEVVKVGLLVALGVLLLAS